RRLAFGVRAPHTRRTLRSEGPRQPRSASLARSRSRPLRARAPALSRKPRRVRAGAQGDGIRSARAREARPPMREGARHGVQDGGQVVGRSFAGRDGRERGGGRGRSRARARDHRALRSARRDPSPTPGPRGDPRRRARRRDRDPARQREDRPLRRRAALRDALRAHPDGREPTVGEPGSGRAAPRVRAFHRRPRAPRARSRYPRAMSRSGSIDLRSDTVTRPSPAMREAMARAEVGDDVLGDDPTVARLEHTIAELLGKEAAVFMPSGTMSNQVALLTHCERGDEVVVGVGAHLAWYESGAGAALAGVQFQSVGQGGTFTADDVLAAVKPEREYHPRTRLVALENTHNQSGGRVFPQQAVLAIADVAERHGLALHL